MIRKVYVKRHICKNDLSAIIHFNCLGVIIHIHKKECRLSTKLNVHLMIQFVSLTTKLFSLIVYLWCSIYVKLYICC